VVAGIEYVLDELNLGHIRDYRRWGWYQCVIQFLEKQGSSIAAWNGPAGVVAVLGLPLLVFWIVYAFLGGKAGFLGLLFSVAVLFFCLGPKDIRGELAALVQALGDNNAEETARRAQELVGSSGSIDPQSRGRTVVESVLVQSNDRIFGVVFWFLVLGPLGAVLYRLSAELRSYVGGTESGFAQSARDLYRILAWAPARLSALGYAGAGNLMKAIEAWRVKDTLGLDQSEGVLKDSGLGALQFADGAAEAEQVGAAQGLITRAVLIWLAAIAVLYLIAWMT
jgi:membrane protein required for beta-lactamase induction